MDERGSLKWRFDISTFRLIGRELITDRVTALLELIKNCYDANATEVKVKFENVGELSPLSNITIQDNGFGMSFEDVRDKWMVIGTSHKRKNTYTPEPIRRRCIGEKGIGRFAVDKLGDDVTITTKKTNSAHWLEIEIDWLKYSKKSEEEEPSFFTDIENSYQLIETNEVDNSGTTIKIKSLRETWSKSDIEKYIEEISKLISPFISIPYPMRIRVIAPEYGIDQIASKNIEDESFATVSFKLNFNTKENYQETLFFNDKTYTLEPRKIAIKSFGGIKMNVFYFDEAARKKYRKEFQDVVFDGIKIYRDGVITTPFAESEQSSDKKRDVLGIDKRLWANLFDRIGTREIIGTVDITKENNPNIIDATNRQDFVDNQEFRELKDFIITQLSVLEQYKKHKRKEKKTNNQVKLEEAREELQALISSAEVLSQSNPTLKTSLQPVVQQAKKTEKALISTIKQQKEAEKEFERKESIYMSIMSMHEYAIHITHAVRTTLNKIRNRYEVFHLYFPDETKNDLFKYYIEQIGKEFVILNKVIDYMLSYSNTNIAPENIQLIDLIKDIIRNYDLKFKTEGIDIELQTPSTIELQKTNRIYFYDIFNNIIDNSIKAVKSTLVKKIKISVSIKDKKLIIKISDTGIGIPEDKTDWVFELYNTTTAESGGGGIGLYIVKTRVESLKGKVYISKSEFGDHGTTICIELPLK